MLVVISVVILACYVLVKWVWSYWTRHGIDGPVPVPIFGNMFDFVRGKKHFGEVYGEIYRYLSFIFGLAQSYYFSSSSFPTANYVGIYKLYSPAVLLRDLNLIHEVLVSKYHCFDQNDFIVNETRDSLMCENPFVATGEKWKERRSQVTPMFTSARVRQTSQVLQNNCEKLLNFVETHRGKDIEVKDVRLEKLFHMNL